MQTITRRHEPNNEGTKHAQAMYLHTNKHNKHRYNDNTLLTCSTKANTYRLQTHPRASNKHVVLHTMTNPNLDTIARAVHAGTKD